MVPEQLDGEFGGEEQVGTFLTFAGNCTCIHDEATHGFAGCEATTGEGPCTCIARWVEAA